LTRKLRNSPEAPFVKKAFEAIRNSGKAMRRLSIASHKIKKETHMQFFYYSVPEEYGDTRFEVEYSHEYPMSTEDALGQAAEDFFYNGEGFKDKDKPLTFILYESETSCELARGLIKLNLIPAFRVTEL